MDQLVANVLTLCILGGMKFRTETNRSKSMTSDRIVRTGRINDEGDELVVFPGWSEAGRPGWFTGHLEVDDLEVSVHPMEFFDSRDGAMRGVLSEAVLVNDGYRVDSDCARFQCDELEESR